MADSDPNRRLDALIFGGGLAGSLLACELQDLGKRILLVDDPSLSRCSRVAAGLINPIGGRRMNLAWMAAALIPYSINRYTQLEERFSQRFFHPRSLARLFASDQERAAWAGKADDPEYKPWIGPLSELALPKPFAADDGFAVRNAGYLDVEALLDALRPTLPIAAERFRYDDMAADESGLSWRGHAADCAIFCEGHLATQNPWFRFVPLKPAKGVIGRAIFDEPLPETAVLKGKFLIPRHDGSCHVGATYRWDDPSDAPDDAGIQEIEAFLQENFGNRWRWERVQAGVRPATAGAKPLVGPHPERSRLLAFNGFGSKGAMQIPYFANALARFLYAGDPLPAEALPARFLTPGPATPARWRATEVAQARVSAILRPGDIAIDATAGNGHDTLWLCQAVGASGHVFAFDIQENALARTSARLDAAGLSDRATLLCAGHEFLDTIVPEKHRANIAAIVFNLGYLPGGDKSLVTRPETTLAALEAGARLLKPGGILSVTLYPAHPGGAEEAEAVEGWLLSLPGASFATEVVAHPANLPDSPFLVFARRRG